MRNYPEEVAELRRQIDSEGLAECLDLMAEITEGLDPRCIRPLLLMREYRDADEHLHEMWAITHEVEGFAAEDYARELLMTAPELSRSSPYYLKFLLLRMLQTDDDVALLSKTLSGTPDEVKVTIRSVLEKVTLDASKRAETKRNAQKILAGIG